MNGEVGTVQGDGSLLAGRTALLGLLGDPATVFVGFITECGSNAFSLGAAAVLQQIEELAIDESATIHIVYF